MVGYEIRKELIEMKEELKGIKEAIEGLREYLEDKNSEQVTNYKIETSDERKLELFANGENLVNALYEILEWYHALYNGKDYDYVVFYRGKLYSSNEWLNIHHEKEEYDEKGYLKDKPEYLYTDEYVMRKIDNCVENVRDFVWRYMGY